ADGLGEPPAGEGGPGLAPVDGARLVRAGFGVGLVMREIGATGTGGDGETAGALLELGRGCAGAEGLEDAPVPGAVTVTVGDGSSCTCGAGRCTA
ncbi:MAG: hypothetical protein ACRDSS_03805, partial [Actinocrinis sp.]